MLLSGFLLHFIRYSTASLQLLIQFAGDLAIIQRSVRVHILPAKIFGKRRQLVVCNLTDLFPRQNQRICTWIGCHPQAALPACSAQEAIVKRSMMTDDLIFSKKIQKGWDRLLERNALCLKQRRGQGSELLNFFGQRFLRCNAFGKRRCRRSIFDTQCGDLDDFIRFRMQTGRFNVDHDICCATDGTGSACMELQPLSAQTHAIQVCQTASHAS